MEKEEIVVGIDVGTTKIAVFIGKRDEAGKISIIGMGKTPSIGVERGVVKNIEATANSIKQAVGQAEAMADYKVKGVYVGIAGHHIKMQQHRGNIMIHDDNHIITAKDVETLKKDQYNLLLPHGEKIIHVIAQSYSVDGDLATTDPVGRVGKCLEGDFRLITGNVTNIQNIYFSCSPYLFLKIINLPSELQPTIICLISNTYVIVVSSVYNAHSIELNDTSFIAMTIYRCSCLSG